MKHVFATVSLAIFLAPAAQAEDIVSLLKRQSKVERPAPPTLNPYNYTVDVTMSGREGKEIKTPFTAKVLVNPAAAPEARIAILSTSSDDYSDDFKDFLKEVQDTEKSAEDLAEDFWCESDDDDMLGDDDLPEDSFTVLSETDTEAVIKPNLKLMAEMMMDSEADDDMSKSERKMMKKMMERLDGEFVLSKPDVRLKRVKIWMTRPMTMAVVAKIKEMEMTQSCALAPNGFGYIDSMTMHVKAKALGMKMEQDMDIKISGLTLR